MDDIDVVVLVDDPALLNAVAAQLAQEGFQALAFADPGRALEALERDPPRLVIADHDLPGTDGVRFAAEARAKLGTMAPRFVLMAGARTRRIDRLDFDAVVHKPFRIDELLSHVRRLLRARSSHQRLKRFEEPTGKLGRG